MCGNFRSLMCASFLLRTMKNLHIRNQGSHNLNSGPDFFNAQIELKASFGRAILKFILNLQIGMLMDMKTDAAYDNVILHVVWEHDAEILEMTAVSNSHICCEKAHSKDYFGTISKTIFKRKKMDQL